MGEIYRFRTVEQLLCEEYRELERQTIYFSDPEQLNDPMEGLRDIVWDGDEVVWTNLFKHYIYCLHSTWFAAQISGDQYTLTVGDIPVFGRWDEDATPELQALFEKIWSRFVVDAGIRDLASNLGKVDHKIRFNELFFHLSLVHFGAVSLIEEVYVDEGYLPQPEGPVNPGLLNSLSLNDSGFFDILPKFREEDFYKNLSPDRRRLFFETLFSIHDNVMGNMLLAHKYHRYRTIPETPSETNQRMLVFNYPELYLNCVEKLLWPQWYTACFTRSYRNSSMWGNYAKKHTGVCLIFETKNSDEGHVLPLNRVTGYSGTSGRGWSETWSLSPMTFRRVDYSAKPKEVDFFRSIGRLPVPALMKMWYIGENGDISGCASHVNADMDHGSWQKSYWEKFDRDIVVKTSDWKYEEEERLILYSLLDPELERRQRALTYEFDSLTGIIFGIKTPDEDKLKVMDIIVRKCRDSGRTDFNFYQAYYSPFEGDIERRKVDIKFV